MTFIPQSEPPLCYSRGDSFPYDFQYKINGVPVDISGSSFLMTVNSDDAPTDTSTQLFQLTGVITDALNGVVRFTPTSANTDVDPDIYFVDIQRTDGTGAISTIYNAQWQLTQDLTKD